MYYTMEYINEKWPEHSYHSCNDSSRQNAEWNRCPRCLALELRSLELRRLGLPEDYIDEEED
jgi:hypothetical protein